MSKKLTTEEFIEKSKAIHGNKYDYSLVEYMNTKSKVKIIFDGIIYEQTPNDHLSKKNSPEKNTPRSTTEEFIKKARLIYGDKYDYSLVEYVNNRTKVKIIYNDKIYLQAPYNHFYNSPEKLNFNISTEEFIEKARLIHGNKYDYSLVEYKTARIKIKIGLNGIWYEQVPHSHLLGYKPESNIPTTFIDTKIFIERSSKIHGNKYDYSLVEYKNYKSKVIILYENKPYLQRAGDHLFGIEPNMGISTGETKIQYYLLQNNIEFEQEFKFKECKNIKPLRFDFYLSKLNILIEFDGKQHFEPIKIFGNEKGFKQCQLNDKIKNEFAQLNNIQLIRISYKEIKLIEQILNEKLLNIVLK